MLDMKFLRENPDLVTENIKKKFQDEKLPLVDEVIALDAANRAAITAASELRASRHALSQNLPSLTLVHKGNIMKVTEGAFRQHGYDVATVSYTHLKAYWNGFSS